MFYPAEIYIVHNDNKNLVTKTALTSFVSSQSFIKTAFFLKVMMKYHT